MGGGGSGSSSWTSRSEPTPSNTKKGAGNGGGSGSNPDACSITFETVLNQPTAVVDSLAKNETLDIALIAENSVKKVAAKKGTRVAGIIVHPRVLDLIECIEIGNQYEAKVLLVNNRRCQVRISRK